MVLHGSDFAACNTDIVIGPGVENECAVARAMCSLNAKGRLGNDFEPDWMQDVRYRPLNLATDAGDLGLILAIPGADDFDSLWQHAVSFRLFGYEVLAASLNDLLKMKRISDRPVDRAHSLEIEALIVLQGYEDNNDWDIRADLIERLKKCFPDPGWPSDISPAEPTVHPGDLDIKYVNEHFTGKKWQEISYDELAWAGSDPWAFSRDGMQYFIPAFMASTLQNSEGRFYELIRRQLSELANRGLFEKCQFEVMLDIWNYLNP